MKKTVSNIIETSSAAWKPARLPGIEFIPLNTDPDERCGTFMYRMEAGAHFPRHRHPAGEEILLIRGDVIMGERALKAGDFLFSPPGSIHEMATREGCLFMAVFPKPVEIVPVVAHDREIEEFPAELPTSDPPLPD
jgi:quercetin dioxygenase-like cupin family protein